jgi:hypothetical protein
MKQLERYLTVSGFTLLAAFTCSDAVLALSPTDSGQLGFGYGALGASGLLECAWILLALPTLVVRWRQTSAKFATLVIVNGMIVLLLMGEAIETIRR